MSDTKPEDSVSATESTKSKSESAPEQTAKTDSEEATPSLNVGIAASAQSQPDEKPSKLDTITDEAQVKNKAAPEKPLEPDTAESERKQSSSSLTSERKQSSASDTAAAERKQSSSSGTIPASERKQSSSSDTAAPKRKPSSASDTSAPSERKQSSASDNTAVPERKPSTASDTERKQSSASDNTAAAERKGSASNTAAESKGAASNTAAVERKLTASQPGPRSKKAIVTEKLDELQDMIREIAGPRKNSGSGPASSKIHAGKETTENLLSVLEDGIEDQAKENLSEPAPAVKPPKPKKYLYKLKSKTGKILHYTSTVPITLKRPVIHLTKMTDPGSKSDPVQKVLNSEKDDVDSDNSTKENNVAPNENVMKVVRKKGRPPLSSRLAPPVITLDGNASDTSDDVRNKSASFSMQTRKRQLKFLPDGRLVTPEKRVKTGDKTQSSSSDSDIDIISDTEKGADSAPSDKSFQKKEFATAGPSTANPVPTIVSTNSLATATGIQKKFRPEMVKIHNSMTTDKRKYKKVFDYESYYREKSGLPSQSGIARTPIGNRSFASNLTPIRKVTDTPAKLKHILPSSPVQLPKKPSSVDPAQLLSSLIGVPISTSQLNVVKFKPKIIQERTNTIVASTPKKVTFEDDRNTKYAPANQSELLKSTPFKIVSKPTYQKILPKPDRQPITHSKMAYQSINIENRFTSNMSHNNVYLTSNSPFLRESLHDTLAKFESFTDSKVVKTKEGPKKGTKRKIDEDVFLKDNNSKTLYDLMYEIFEKMPSWNLHVVPDTNCFCIAQVSRGRMGIPTLKKSIEINSEFFAKVYVHQLQCKRYDGIYDTESKIVKLIKEIDALAA